MTSFGCTAGPPGCASTTYYLQEAGQAPGHSIPLAAPGAAIRFGNDRHSRLSGLPRRRKTPLPIINTESAPARGRLSPHSIQRGVPAEGPSIIYGVALAPTARLRGIDPLGSA